MSAAVIFRRLAYVTKKFSPHIITGADLKLTVSSDLFEGTCRSSL